MLTPMSHVPCPKCDGREKYEVDRALIPNYEFSNTLEPLTLTGAMMPTKSTGFLSPTAQREVVTVKAVVCAGCGFTELYARELNLLAEFAQAGKGNVRKRS
jgi:predicted nucleic-acid-binding Zn-ribbon protein